MEDMEQIEKIITALRRVRMSMAMEESEIHLLIAAALEKEGIVYEHEYRLAPRCRLDFFCGGIAIEVKKDRPDKRSLARQVTRYLQSEKLTGLIVAAPYSLDLPSRINSKPVKCVALSHFNGVTLP